MSYILNSDFHRGSLSGAAGFPGIDGDRQVVMVLVHNSDVVDCDCCRVVIAYGAELEEETV